MIREAVKHIYPEIKDSQFELQDDGAGPYFVRWNYLQPKPSMAQLDAAMAEIASRSVIPSEISMRQARLALLQSGLLAQVDAAITAMTGAEGNAARIDWQFAQTVERTHPLVATMTAQLNLTTQQLDDLFTLGATL